MVEHLEFIVPLSHSRFAITVVFKPFSYVVLLKINYNLCKSSDYAQLNFRN